MLGRQILPKICMLSVALLLSSHAMAQVNDRGLSEGPSGRPFTKGPDNALEDGFYQYDAQLWAPVDYTSMDGRIKSPTGFYSSAEMSYLSVSRPGAITGQTSTQFQGGNSFHWGKNYEAGFMSEKGRGFAARWQHLTGVSITAGTAFASTQTQLLDLTYDTLELNRVFREDTGNGCYYEPYIGMRYTHIGDRTIENRTIQIGANANHQLIQKVNNSALGGQVGARFVKRRGRFTYESDIALAGQYNRQGYRTFAQLIDLAGVVTEREVANDHTNFLPTLDMSANMQYEITRDISIRFGAEAQFMWEGVARADTRPSQLNPHGLVAAGNPTGVFAEHFFAAGVNFGLDWKR